MNTKIPAIAQTILAIIAIAMDAAHNRFSFWPLIATIWAWAWVTAMDGMRRWKDRALGEHHFDH